MPGKQVREKDLTKDGESGSRRKSNRSRRVGSKSPERGPPSPSGSTSRRKRSTTSDPSRTRSSLHRSSPASSKTSLPYPAFSKAHSKESVAGDIPASPFTPNPTDVTSHRTHKARTSPDQKRSATGKGKAAIRVAGASPPSPPLTSLSEQLRHQGASRDGRERTGDYPDAAGTVHASANPSSGPSGPAVSACHDPTERTSDKNLTSNTSQQSRRETEPRSDNVTGSAANAAARAKVEDGSILGSEGTSVTEVLPRTRRPTALEAARAATSSVYNVGTTETTGTVPQTPGEHNSTRLAEHATEGKPSDFLYGPGRSPQPPPPPPPPTLSVNPPRVDYLLHHGGLPHHVPRRFLDVGRPPPLSHPSAGARHDGTTGYPPGTAPTDLVEHAFAPYNALLRHYETVVERNGSLAVATGYRSIARRLLDRLEAIFARDISSELCICPFCQHSDSVDDFHQGLGWGDVLEWVSGRKSLPPWPPFDFEGMGRPFASGDGPDALVEAVSNAKLQPPRPASVDADVPSEFRDHYRRQTKKKKEAVDRWLARQLINPTAPPQGIDDETLTFAILTHLKQTERDDFSEILGLRSPSAAGPMSNQPTEEEVVPLLSRTALALQRLYRLTVAPRDPESAAYLVKYPAMHQVLATLAAVNSSEWDILTSGRFDGFLWGGADDFASIASPPRSSAATPWQHDSTGLRSLSPADRVRSTTMSPADVPRNTTPSRINVGSPALGPGSGPGPPVSHDEETEIAVLAEVERDIYLSMEALEDAFETLHKRAEMVRKALRERGAGLSLAAQARRQLWSGTRPSFDMASGSPGVGRPFNSPGLGGGVLWESEDDVRWSSKDADAVSEVWPDDSASNVSTSRVRRPRRRTERRTPAPVEECDEGR